MTTRPDAAQRRALVCVAAGSGTRLGRGLPKALVPVAGRSMLARALDGVAPEIGYELVVLVLPDDPEARRRLGECGTELAAALGVDVVPVPGAGSRPASVRRGVEAVADHAAARGWAEEDTAILVHDAARPLTPAAVHLRVLDALSAGWQAVVPAVAVADTIKAVAAPDADPAPAVERVAGTPPRGGLRAVQTPQGFTLPLLRRAFSHIGELPDEQAERLTDEAMIAEDLGVDVGLVPGDARSLKITTPTDLLAAEALLSSMEEDGAEDPPAPDPAAPSARAVPPVVVPRVGVGHDVHAFAGADEDRELMLAGLHWPGERGLSGHSDGDVVAHAACDAIFSAAGIGDMGVHFGADTIGTTRPELAGASGVVLLAEAVRLVGEAGFRVGSVSVQLVGARPKFGPRRAEAQQVLTEAAGAPVAVSATTSDGLGFTGRVEGVLATATAVLVEVGAEGPA
ncbi:2-C-methyl-D-erythritol 2,4-cyclodiphosphate synthase [Nesterenkonia sp. F]|uniref:2-C-methyl-D-erythritol 2,4-cyclodiphosphate synthase n=1 Tax=Nesterenkonia sp. F TaxID=795955 RepID=UPI0004965D9F|nr:2-C-methyl-D-erythritol 2,4-cyclodiphosphate synthase [Nesterenkonia sp. F]